MKALNPIKLALLFSICLFLSSCTKKQAESVAAVEVYKSWYSNFSGENRAKIYSGGWVNVSDSYGGDYKYKSKLIAVRNTKFYTDSRNHRQYIYFWFEREDYIKRDGKVITLQGNEVRGYANTLVEVYRFKRNDGSWDFWKADIDRECGNHDQMEEVFENFSHLKTE